MLTPSTADVLAMINGPDPRPRSYRESVRASSPNPPAPVTVLVPKDPTVNTLAELLVKSFPPVVWTVPGLIQRGSCLILAGKPKSGKSRLALSIAVAVAVGGYVLGTIPVIQGDVLYLSLEDGERRLQQRVRQLLANDPDAKIDHFDYACEWPKTDDGGLGFIREQIKLQRNPTLVVIDTLARVRPTEKAGRGVYSQDYEALASYADLAHELNVSVIVITHTRKSTETDDIMDLISGSTGLTGAVDGTMILQRKRVNKDGTLTVIFRDAEDAELSLELDNLTGGWRMIENADKVRTSEERLKVLQKLYRFGEANLKELAPLVGATYDATAQLVYKMADSKPALVERVRAGTYRITTDGRQVVIKAEVESEFTDPIDPNDQKVGSIGSIGSHESQIELPDAAQVVAAAVAAITRRGGALWVTDGELSIDVGTGPPDEILQVPGSKPKRLRSVLFDNKAALAAYVEARGGLVDSDGALFDSEPGGAA